MKTKDPKLTHLIVLITALLMFFAGCTEDTSDPKQDPNPDVDEIGTVPGMTVLFLNFKPSTRM